MAYHEPYEFLGDRERDISRLLRSLIEELEAIDWYNQRMSVSKDPDVIAVVKHNRDEEMEHAAMLLETIRRRWPEFDRALRTYLFTNAPVTEIESAGTSESGDDGKPGSGLLKP